MSKFISPNFEVVDSIPGYFEVDDDIALVIALLNKKGYITTYSCSGHNKIEYTDEDTCSIDLLEDLIDDDRIRILRHENNKTVFTSEVLGNSTYITFKDAYEFDTLPNGFTLNEFNNGLVLSKSLDYYPEGSKIRKSQSDIDKEVKNNCLSLLKWAKNLEKREEKIK